MNSKISIVEAVFMIILVVGADAVAGFGTLGNGIPVIGQMLWLVGWLTNIVVWAILMFWLTMKGVSTSLLLGSGAIEAIPILNALPALTAATIAIIIKENLPENIKRTVEKAEKVTRPISK